MQTRINSTTVMKYTVLTLICAVAAVANGARFGNADPSQAKAICAAETADGVLVAHENCNQFYKCSEGLPVALDCPVNLLYNPQFEYCDWPENVNCGNRVIGGGNPSNPSAPGGNADPSQAKAICAAETADGVLVAHENCNQFYKCSEGLPVALDCPGSLLFHPEFDWCDWPENVNCGNRVIGGGNPSNPSTPGGNASPSQAKDICAAENAEGVLVAHENCNQFYKCSEGLPVVFNCPDYLLFNPKNDQCDWPHNVTCP